MRNACRKDDSRGGIRQCANSSYTFAPLTITFILTLFRSSDVRKMRNISTRIPAMSQGEILWQGVSKHGLE